jgi:hypothetical protein
MMPAVLTRFRPLALLAAGTLLLAGCADTVKLSSWTAPGVTSLHFKKIVVVALARQELNRRLVENRVSAEIKKIEAVPSNELIPGVLTKDDKDRLIKAVTDSGADGLVVMRLTSSDVTNQYTGSSIARPAEYMTYSGYYGSVYSLGYFGDDRRTVGSDTVMVIETNVYDVKTQRLLWSGATESTKDFIKIQNVGAIATEVAKKLKDMVQADKLAP